MADGYYKLICTACGKEIERRLYAEARKEGWYIGHKGEGYGGYPDLMLCSDLCIRFWKETQNPPDRVMANIIADRKEFEEERLIRREYDRWKFEQDKAEIEKRRYE